MGSTSPDRLDLACDLCGAVEPFEIVCQDIEDWEYGHQGRWDYVRCLRCGLVKLHPMPALDELIAAYPPQYHGYRTSSDKGALYNLLHKAYLQIAMRRWLEIAPRGARILDVGCGDGSFARNFAPVSPSRIEGLDFNERAIALAREKGVEAHRCLFLDLDREPGSYDVVIMNNYLEHTSSPLEELRKAHRLLAPGGHLIGEVPNFAALDRAVFRRYWGGNHAPRHTFQFTSDTLRRTFDTCGFPHAEIWPSLTPTHLALSVQNVAVAKAPRRHPFREGRSKLFGALMLATFPVHLTYGVFGRSGSIAFDASR